MLVLLRVMLRLLLVVTLRARVGRGELLRRGAMSHGWLLLELLLELLLLLLLLLQGRRRRRTGRGHGLRERRRGVRTLLASCIVGVSKGQKYKVRLPHRGERGHELHGTVRHGRKRNGVD